MSLAQVYLIYYNARQEHRKQHSTNFLVDKFYINYPEVFSCLILLGDEKTALCESGMSVLMYRAMSEMLSEPDTQLGPMRVEANRSRKKFKWFELAEAKLGVRKKKRLKISLSNEQCSSSGVKRSVVVDKEVQLMMNPSPVSDQPICKSRKKSNDGSELVSTGLDRDLGSVSDAFYESKYRNGKWRKLQGNELYRYKYHGSDVEGEVFGIIEPIYDDVFPVYNGERSKFDSYCDTYNDLADLISNDHLEELYSDECQKKKSGPPINIKFIISKKDMKLLGFDMEDLASAKEYYITLPMLLKKSSSLLDSLLEDNSMKRIVFEQKFETAKKCVGILEDFFNQQCGVTDINLALSDHKVRLSSKENIAFSSERQAFQRLMEQFEKIQTNHSRDLF